MGVALHARRRISAGWSLMRTAVVVATSITCCSTGNPEWAFEPALAWEPANEVEAECAQMCASSIDLGCEMTNSVKRCAENCAESVATTGDCVSVTRAYVDCLGSVGLDTCFDIPDDCADVWAQWSSCSSDGTGCGPVNCGDEGDEECACRSSCGGQIVENRCVLAGDIDGDSYWSCACHVDGELVTSCLEEPAGCAFFAGCCASAIAAITP